MICGDKFIGVSDFIYSPRIKHKDDYDRSPNTLTLFKLKDGSIIYTHSFYAKQLFSMISGVLKDLVIITHNGDTNIDGSFRLPANVVKWHAQNVDVENSRIESIPIGIENDRWMQKVDKKRIMAEKLKEKKVFKNLVYMNFSIKTNPCWRKAVYDSLKEKPFVTTRMGENGSYFEQYIDNVYNHKYVVCPRGNGLDTHRFWETLYMGSVPIVVRNINNWFYNDLPVLYVNDWSEITGDLLIDKWCEFKDMDWNREKLTFKYWENKIKS